MRVRGVVGVDEAEVEGLALLLVGVRDELAALAELLEAVDGVLVIFAFRTDKLDEAVETCQPFSERERDPGEIYLSLASCAWPGSERKRGSRGRTLLKATVSWLP